MKIALIGYGKMGKEIEKLAQQRDHEIIFRIDNEDDWHKYFDALSESDVAIEFSLPEVVTENIKKCFRKNIPVVVGTTAWYGRLEEIKDLCESDNQSLIYASNFSIGVNIFFELNRRLAAIMNNHPNYDISIAEEHHIHKIDAPSGTAITLAKDVIDILESKKSWAQELTNDKTKVHITSRREGEITGTHIIRYESDIDIIELKHQAKNRRGFALGAILAAEWITGKKGFYEIRDMLNL